jgi:hypothetical protein
LQVRVRATLSARGGHSVRGFWTVREESADRVFVVFFVCSRAFVFRSIYLVVFYQEEFVGQSVRGGRTVREAWTVRECSADGPFFAVHYWRFGNHFRTVRRMLADSLPPPCGRSAQAIADCLSPLLIEFCFRFGIVWGLLLGLVCPLRLRDLGKLMWESLVVNLGHKTSLTFRNNFY